jgi:hypothetical protein
MSKKEFTKTPTIPDEIRELLGDPPLLVNEDFEQYEGMLIRFAHCVKPRDPIEWFWVKDLTDARYEIQRFRNFKSRLVEVATEAKREQSIKQINSNYESKINQLVLMDSLGMPCNLVWVPPAQKDQAEQIMAAKQEKYDEQMKEYEKNRPEKERQLKAAMENLEAAAQKQMKLERARADDGAGAFESWIESYERTDRLQTAAEKRFNDTVEQLDFHRQGLGLRLRQASDEIVDGEFNEVPASFPGSSGADDPAAARASPALPADAAVAPAPPVNNVEAAELAVARQPEATAPAPCDVPANDATIAPAPPAVSSSEQDGEPLAHVPPTETTLPIGEGEAPPVVPEPTDTNPVHSA